MLRQPNQAPDSPEVLFLRSYKDAIMFFNMLDRNLAYCLRGASSSAGAEVDLLTVLSYPYDKKLKEIKSLILKRGRESEYSEFLRLAEQCRTLRNKLVHGHWAFVARLPKPIRFQVPAPYQEEGYLTQDEFSAQAALCQRANSLFVKLQGKHPITHS
jgi:hypothetical protein